MKKLSKLLAIVLSVAMLATAFVGCHEKDEIAFTIGDSEFTSAMYSCVLFIAAGNARSDIDTYIKDNKIETKTVDYSSYKFDDKGNVSAEGTVPYNTYVRNEAIKVLKQYAALDTMMKANNLKLDDESVQSAQLEAFYQWYYGCSAYNYQYYTGMGYNPASLFTPMGAYMEKNGVAYSTYQKYVEYEVAYTFYFNHLYGEGGEKEVPTDELTKYMTENYTVADSISFSKKDSDGKALSDEKIAELKAIADGYAERLNAGELFEDIYKEEQARLEAENKKDDTTSSDSSSSGDTSSDASSNESTSSGTASSDTTSSGSEDKGYTPADYVGIYGKEGTPYEHDMFSEVLKQEFGKAVVLEDTENSRYLLVVRRDMTDSSFENYWFDNMRDTMTSELRQDEYDNFLNEYGNTLKLAEDTHATKPFGVKDITFDIK